MLIKILIVVAVVVVLLLVVIATRPADFRIERTASIGAPPAAVFGYVNDLHKWEPWNPWGKIDPAMKLTYEGAAAGPGAVYSWVGNSKVGEGRMTIVESRPNELIRLKLEFFKPMAGICSAEFAFKPAGNQTEVTWSMAGKNNFIAKAMCLFMSMDKMVGGQFEQGLATLKSIAEADSKKS